MPANPVLALNDVIEFTVKAESQAQGQQVINRSYWRVNGVPSPAVDDLLDCNDEIAASWAGNFLPVLSADYKVISYESRRVSGITPYTVPLAPFQLFYDAAVGRSPVADVGAIAGPPAPSFITASIWFRTGYIGRYWRGGMRLGTLPAADIDTAAGKTNKFLPAQVTLYQAAAVAFIAPLVTAGGTTLQIGILSPTYWYKVLLSIGTASDAFANMFSALVSDYVRHQDSRAAPKVP